MVSWLLATPGRLYVVATLLPLAAFGLLLVGGCLRHLCRPYREDNGLARFCLLLPRRRQATPGRGLLRHRSHGRVGRPRHLGLVRFLRRRGHAQPADPLEMERRWAEQIPWAQVGIGERRPAGRSRWNWATGSTT